MTGPLIIIASFVSLFPSCASNWDSDPFYGEKPIPICGTHHIKRDDIDLREPDTSSTPIYYDLTRKEMKDVREYFENEESFKVVKSSKAEVSSSYILTADLYLRKKSDVLKGRRERRARVVLFRGDKTPPVVEEYVCDLWNSINCVEFRKVPVPFSYRPFTEIEFKSISRVFGKTIDEELGQLLSESFNVTSFSEFRLIPSPLPSAFSNNPMEERLVWVLCSYDVTHAALHPVDFGVLVDTFSSNASQWKIKKVLYAGDVFKNLNVLKELYNTDEIAKLRITKPKGINTIFSTLDKRGLKNQSWIKRPPLQVEPDSKRYSLKYKQVNYFGWSFSFRMSSITGPALYNLKFNDENIAYEISLSEVAAYYFGNGPTMTSHSLFSSALLGLAARTIIPGADCPDYATVISQLFFNPYGDEPLEVDGAFCLFETNNGNPLRRHSAYDSNSGSFYGGMLDSALTLRTILVLGNSDYVFDFIFHQDGSFESKVMATGYMQVNPARPGEKPNGYRLRDSITGVLHQHLFHFKVDLDILGAENSFKTLDLSLESVNLQHDLCKKIIQPGFKPCPKNSESASVYNFNPEKPQYLIVSSKQKSKTEHELRSYRIKLDGAYQSLLPWESFTEPSISWARHQLVATKQKDNELSSSSIYAMYDSSDPVVRFTDFYLDNDMLDNTDIVFWITGSMYDIPRSEDLPVSSTVGKHLSFYLLPFNFFPECPSMNSNDALFIRVFNESSPKKLPFLDRYGKDVVKCTIPCPTLDNLLFVKPNFAIDTRPS